MGILKDIYEIIKDEKDAKKLIDKSLLDFLKGGGLFKHTPTIKERRTRLNELVVQLTQDGFGSSFNDSHAYLFALVGVAAEVGDASNKGCVVEKLFLPDYCFYFAPPARAASIAKGESKVTKENWRSLVYDDDASAYVFCAVRGVDSTPLNVTALRKKLDGIAKTNPESGEFREFTDWLKADGHEVVELKGIGFNPTTRALRYIRRDNWADANDPKLLLDFSDVPATRVSFARELKRSLDSHLL